MMTLELPFNRTARVWIDQLPQAHYEEESAVKEVFEAVAPPFTDNRRAAVELLYAPTGPRSIYGLIGAALSPSRSDRLSTQVNITGRYGPRFLNSLAGSSDDVRVGLPEEYVAAVFDGVLEARRQLGNLPAGVLVFDCAAHGIAGSCELAFTHLSSIVIKILSMKKLSDFKPELADFFQSNF